MDWLVLAILLSLLLYTFIPSPAQPHGEQTQENLPSSDQPSD